MQIIQIVPRLPPAIDGVGDYALLLAKELRAAHGIQTVFVVCDTAWGKAEGRKQKSEIELDGFKVFQLQERSAAELLRVLSLPEMPQTILLQYVGYGYQKRGCPVWLVRGLEKWRKQKDEFQLSALPDSKFPISALPNLVTMFHELYASGPPWRSSFWTSPTQRWIAKSLARSSECCFTNRAASATWLAATRHHPLNAIPVFPVFSNLGEPESVSPLALRKPQMLIYGGLSRSPNDRDLAIKSIRQTCNKLGIKQLIAFGSKTVDPASVGLPVENVGVITGKDASKLLSESRAGYLDYFDGYLAKSGVFAFYCAYGLVPVLLRKNGSDADGLEKGKHFLAASVLPEEVGIQSQQHIAGQAHKWYDRHSVIKTAIIFADKLKPMENHVDLPVEK